MQRLVYMWFANLISYLAVLIHFQSFPTKTCRNYVNRENYIF